MIYRLKAPAKINLSLDIVSKRPDGYHNLRSVMHTVPLYDCLELSENSDKTLRIEANIPELCPPEKNIVYKAYRAFYEKTGISPCGFDVRITKNIPACAGLGGGSSDGAEILRFLNEYHNYPCSEAELIRLGASVGADIPFLIKGGCCLCEGIGDILTPLPTLMPVKIIIAKPLEHGLSTPEIFSLIDEKKPDRHPDTEGLINGLRSGSLKDIASSLYNAMEEVSIEKCPDIEEIKNTLLENGAEASVMSGSGNSVFGIFDKSKDTDNAVEALNRLDTKLFISNLSL